MQVVWASVLCSVLVGCSESGEAGPRALGRSAPLPWHSFDATGPLEFAADSWWADTAPLPLQATLTATNRTTDTVWVGTGPCGFGLRAYRTPDLATAPAWDDRPPPNVGCPDVGLEFTIPPGASEAINVHEFGNRVFESLPEPGSYYIAIVLKEDNGTYHLVPAGQISIP